MPTRGTRRLYLLVTFISVIASVFSVSAQPAQPSPSRTRSFRVLVVASRARDHQQMIAAARPFFGRMAADHHFQLDFTDDTSQINSVNLRRYKVFIPLELAPFDLSAAQREAVQQFVKEGNGWVGIHAAGLTGSGFLAPGTAYREWFEDFMGGILYSSHPAFQRATVHVDDHYHPLTAHLPATMNWADDWYEWTPNPRGRVHVLATVDESTYHQNKPMGDHPVIWTNERFRRMVYIGPGHDPALLLDSNYARLLLDAILWAGSGDILPPVTMKNGIIDYEQDYDLPGSPSVGYGFNRVKAVIDRSISRATLPLSVTLADRDSIGGIANMAVGGTRRSGRFRVKFDWVVSVTAGQYRFHTRHYYEEPLGPGVSHAWSKMEYRWGDYRVGHPWSSGDKLLFRALDSTTRAIMATLSSNLGARRSPRLAAIPAPPAFKVLAFYSHAVEPDHVAFANDATRFYSGLAQRQHFSFDTTSDWAGMSAHLGEYQVIVWLNDFPHTEAERSAFQRYMENGGAWLGCHVSAYNDRDTHWPWLVGFLGGAVFHNNSWPPLPAKLIVEDRKHPVTVRMPSSYLAPLNEWYGWLPDPRKDPAVTVLVSLDPANYPLGKKDILRTGDIPVVWTNTKYRMLYLNMGHGDQVLSSPVQNRLFEDGLLWLGTGAGRH